jgi:hypothetical protein
MFVKIDIRSIVQDHLRTLIAYDSGKTSRGDVALFYLVPIVIAVGLALGGVTLDPTAVNILITALSIFTGLLLNLLLLIHGLIRKGVDAGIPDERIVLRQLYCNISYNILIAIVALMPLLAITIFPHHLAVVRGSSVIIYFLVANFVLTLLMILKRVHALLTSEFRRAG